MTAATQVRLVTPAEAKATAEWWLDPIKSYWQIFYRVGGHRGSVDHRVLRAMASAKHPFTWPVMDDATQSEAVADVFFTHIAEAASATLTEGQQFVTTRRPAKLRGKYSREATRS